MDVLVVNVGGVTLELSVVAGDGRLLETQLVDPWDGTSTSALEALVGAHAEIGAVGHRIVHGGEELEAPVVIDDAVVEQIHRAGALAPLHQDRALAGIAAARHALGPVRHVACFDTTFHRTLPAHVATYPIPAEWRRQWPVHRFGFHGISHQHVARVAASIAGRDALQCRRIVSCHLGSGASACAILDGRSVDTTMGMTPLEGLAMVTRSGTVDPGLLLFLIQQGGLSAEEVSDGLYHRSGLAGLSGGTGDMRDVLQRIAAGEADAQLALDVYVHRLRAAIASMTASLGGIDVLAFTGGVGEHVAAVRAGAVGGLEHLGLRLDRDVNVGTESDGLISPADAATASIVVTTGENLEIARQVLDLLGR